MHIRSPYSLDYTAFDHFQKDKIMIDLKPENVVLIFNSPEEKKNDGIENNLTLPQWPQKGRYLQDLAKGIMWQDDSWEPEFWFSGLMVVTSISKQTNADRRNSVRKHDCFHLQCVGLFDALWIINSETKEQIFLRFTWEMIKSLTATFARLHLLAT